MDQVASALSGATGVDVDTLLAQVQRVDIVTLALSVALGVLLSSVLFCYCLLRGGASDVRPRSLKPPADDSFSVYTQANEPYWTHKADTEMPVRLAKRGVASSAPRTVMSVFLEAVDNKAEQLAMVIERDGEIMDYTWGEYCDDVFDAGKSLVKLGFKAHDCVNLIGFNSPEYLIASLGCMAAGGHAAGVYATNNADACHYVSEHSKGKVVFVEDELQLKKYVQIASKLPMLVALVIYRPIEQSIIDAANKSVGKKVTVFSWDDFLELGIDDDDDVIMERIDAQKPGHVCQLIYTSGTTGNPKAVMINNDNVVFTTLSFLSAMPESFGTVQEHVISYLPLSHIAALVEDLFCPIIVAATMPGNMTIHFAKPDALKGSLGETMKRVRPTLFFGVPRVYEKIQEKVKQIGAQTKGIKRKIATWAKGLGKRAFEAEMSGSGSFRTPFGFPLAQALVLDKVREALGLDRCAICLTGAAPIQRSTLEFFGALYLPIYNLYGMSESTGPHTCSLPGANKLGSAGRCLPGFEIRIDHDSSRGDKDGEGEICFRGRHVFQGYLGMADKTKETIDPDGWLHSGDIGRLDEDGFLFITGRIKSLLITQGGENIAPVPMEAAIKSKCSDGVSNIVMIGDQRKYCVCLVTLKVRENDDGTFSNDLQESACKIGSAKTVAEARTDKQWQAYIQAAIDYANETVAISRASKIQKFYILDCDFSAHGDTPCLTPTLKLKRPVVNKVYAKEIDALYK